MGHDRHQAEPWEFPLPIIFTYVQQVSSPVEMNNSKDHVLTQFMHRNLYKISTSRKQKDKKVIHILGNEIKHWKHLSACEDDMDIRLL